MHAMTGSWLIVKWIGMAVLALYLVLLLVAAWLYRNRLSQLRGGLYLPIVLGNFISLSVPWIFDNVAVTRACFLVAQAFYIAGILILVRGLAQKDQGILMRSGN